MELTGVQKVAVVLMQMGDAASNVMKNFSDAEAEEVAAELVKLRRVHADVAERTIAEFHELILTGKTSARGGRDLAAEILEGAFGSERAGGIINRMASTLAGKSFEFLDTAEPGQLVGILDGELPDTIALVLGHLRPAVAAEVIAGLPEAQRTDVAEAIATMGTALPEAVSAVAEVLKVRVGAVVAPRETVEAVGGVQPLVDIINRSDVSIEKSLLASLDIRNPELAEDVRSRMLTFADIVKLEPREVQAILRGVNTATLAIAMAGASEQVTDVIRRNITERNREILDSEISTSGPHRMKAVEEARATIVQAIRTMEAEGSIVVRRGEDDEYVY